MSHEPGVTTSVSSENSRSGSRGESSTEVSRRGFLARTGATGLVAGSAAGLVTFGLPIGAYAAGNELLKVGLIGCGGRGTQAAKDALQADPNIKLWAVGDAFRDRVESSLISIRQEEEFASKIDVPADRQFVGFDAYQHVIDCCDVVLLCTPPHFRPLHLKAAVEKGRHVFAEKPVAVDAPGARSVLETCRLASQKGLSIVSGLCQRYDAGMIEMVKRVHQGEIGNIVAIQANDYRGQIWVKPRQKEWSDMEYQMRNWYYFTWLSGDFNVEQHVHNLDFAAWLLKDEYPLRATGVGGRQVRVEEEYGHIYDHFSVVYEYASGVKLFATTRQMQNCPSNISVETLGSKGSAFMSGKRISVNSGGEQWLYKGKHKNMYQVEHDELFASIRKGQPINNGEYMTKSSMMAVLGRMSAYTGKTLTWEDAMSSKEDLTPAHYTWGELPTPTVAMPGKTKFV